ncbi:type VI secretion system baseplate subunit TssG, partial [Salmonella enterica subsp. enterica serovar Kentucky]|nr:type VI secretion system baseplate subunit TssG [Salmonella enterica subsp. enterica serovar Kentucky]
LRADAVKGVTPGGTGRLGYSAWLGKQPTPQPRGDLVFRAES